MIQWNQICWDKVQHKLFKMQQQVYQASKKNSKRKVHALQRSIIQSFDARLIALRCVIDCYPGTNFSQSKKMTLVEKLKLDEIRSDAGKSRLCVNNAGLTSYRYEVTGNGRQLCAGFGASICFFYD